MDQDVEQHVVIAEHRGIAAEDRLGLTRETQEANNCCGTLLVGRSEAFIGCQTERAGADDENAVPRLAQAPERARQRQSAEGGGGKHQQSEVEKDLELKGLAEDKANSGQSQRHTGGAEDAEGQAVELGARCARRVQSQDGSSEEPTYHDGGQDRPQGCERLLKSEPQSRSDKHCVNQQPQLGR